MLKAIIIDDELNAIELVSTILNDKFPDIEIIGTAQSPLQGVKLINNLKPNLVFLDIEMPEADGFELLEALPDKNFCTIFITAYDKYAIKAIKHSALDYLLKPIDVDEFCTAVNKAIEKLDNKLEKTINYNTLIENLKSNQLSKIALPSNKGIEYVEIKDIIKIDADGRYSVIYLINKRKITVTKQLNELVELLESDSFFRPHKSHFINLNFVKMFIKTEGNSIEMIDGSQVSLSRNKKEEFFLRMGSFVKSI